MRKQLLSGGVSESVVDDAVLILSELLSNSCRHGRPLDAADAGEGAVRAAWHVDAHGGLTLEVTDGGGPTRPVPATPSVTARGGRGLNIISALALEWGVRDGAGGEVTVWVTVTGPGASHADRATRVNGHHGDHRPTRGTVPGAAGSGGLGGMAATAPIGGEFGFLDAYEDVD